MNLQRALEEQKKQNQQEVAQIAGLLGIPLSGQRRVEVPNRNSYVFVRLRSNTSEVIQAYNNQVAPAYDLPVIVERHGNKYIVAGVDSGRYENNWASQSPFLPRHGNTHTFDLESGGGGDVVWVQSSQFVPSLVFPSGSVGGDSVIVHPYTLRNDNGTWRYTGNTGTSSFAPYRPSSPTGAIMALVYLDSNTGNPQLLINSGSVFSNSITGSSQITPYIPSLTNPSRDIPLAAVRLITGTNVISWNNIYDVRQWLHTIPTGSAGGISSVAVQDEGAPQGTATTFNFVGNGVQATISGSVARIDISGGSVNTGTLDARYLKLDTSNDPLVGNLRVSGSVDIYTEEGHSNGPLTIGSERSSTLAYLYQQYHASGEVGSPVILIERYPFDVEQAVVSAPFLEFKESRISGSINGQFLSHTVDGVERVSLYPNATGTIPNYSWDTTRTRPTGTIHSQWLVSGSAIAYVNVSGTFHSNGVPLVKEAPITTGSYVRRNAGWVVQGPLYLPLGVYTHISPMTATASAPYAASIDRSTRLAQWVQDYFVAGTSDGSNYWTVELIIADVNNAGTTIASFTTGGTAASTWGRSTITSFSVNPVTTSYYNMFIYLTKTGAPGNIYFPGPLMEITA